MCQTELAKVTLPVERFSQRVILSKPVKTRVWVAMFASRAEPKWASARASGMTSAQEMLRWRLQITLVLATILVKEPIMVVCKWEPDRVEAMRRAARTKVI